MYGHQLYIRQGGKKYNTGSPLELSETNNMKKLLILIFLLPLFCLSQNRMAKYEKVVTLNASDDEGDEFYWTVQSGSANNTFVILPCSGEIKVDTSIYSKITYSKTFYLTCRATDQLGLFAIEKLKVILWKSKGVRKVPKVYRIP